jgi:hypothetical protein
VHLSIRKVAFFGLPLAAVVLGVILMSWGFSQKATADFDPVVNMSISGTGCNSSGVPTAKCSQAAGSTAVYSFNLDTAPVGGYSGYEVKLDIQGNINYINFGEIQPNPAPNQASCGAVSPPAASNPACFYNDFGSGTTLTGSAPPDAVPKQGNANELGGGQVSVSGAQTAIVQGNPRPLSTYTGSLFTFQIVCKASGSGTITMIAGDNNSDIQDGGQHSEAASESLTVNCNPAPTATPIPPTPTPPPNPRVQKLPVIQNVFLTHQGAKLPPATCETGTNVADLEESINIPITSPDPKNPSVFQKLGAFQFEARFDDKLVCVSVEAGGDWATNTQVLCSQVAAKGLLRFGCVTTGKNAGLDGPGVLAILHVRPQEELYSQLRPNQDNGIPVQILNQGCNLADEQGHVITIFSCEDADITFRYLEGDVDGPDCSVDVLDMQNVAFRWGAAKGSLLYSSFLDLSPSGQIKGDGRIDIKDLQFVFGRATSTCAVPWPAQAPVNPKA